MQNTQNNTTLVIGGNGKTGRRIAEKLSKGGQPIRIASRSSDIPFDWEKPDTWAAALEGCEQAYVAYYPDLAVPGALEAIKSLCNLAREKGLRKIVLLSGRGEPEAQACEFAVKESGLAWTIIRCSWFNQNFSESFLLDYVLAGTIALPAGDIQEPFVDADDIADVAVAALTDHKHDGELYELTGPDLLSFQQIAEIISSASGNSINFINTTHEAFIESLEHANVPEPMVQLLDYLMANVLDGRNAYLCDGVQRALGREPKSFVDYAKEVARSGVWNTEIAMTAK